MDPVIPFNSSVNRNEDENTDNETKFSNESDFESESSDESVNSVVKENDDHVQFRPFFKAFQEKDWKGTEEFITKNPQALTAKIKVYGEETVLHLITRNLDVPIWLMEKLASMVSPESLEHLTDGFGCSVLSCAAANRNTKAAEVFVRRNKNLPNISSNHRNRFRFLPIHDAAISGHKETIQYLLRVTTVPLDDERGVSLLDFLINSGLYGIAFDLMKRYPNLARERNQDRRRILVILANNPLAFESGSRLGYWKRLIYSWIPVEDDHIEPCPQSVDGDIENPIKRSNSKKLRKFTHLGFLQQISTALDTLGKNFHIVFWNALMKLAPSIKCIRDTKLEHMQTHEIVKMLCHGVIWSNKQALESLCTPLLTAAKLGICEIVDEIRKAYYYSYTFVDMNSRHNILYLSILHRQEKVFSLLNKTNLFSRHWNVVNLSAKAENILHLAARSIPNSSQVSGAAAALQMQRELQWFKTLESYVSSSHHEQRNFSNKTPREVFTKEHENLFEEGKEWVRATAAWCSVVASLIIVIELFAAFNVPGGNYYTERIPLFLLEASFKVFAISNVLALFTSTASLLLFFSIIASRYSEQDFLESLPKKLIIGLITLFVSIGSMPVAVGATIYMFLSHPWKGAIIPISILGCLPLILFALKCFPLLVEISSSTYGPSIFQPAKRRQKNL